MVGLWQISSFPYCSVGQQCCCGGGAAVVMYVDDEKCFVISNVCFIILMMRIDCGDDLGKKKEFVDEEEKR